MLRLRTIPARRQPRPSASTWPFRAADRIWGVLDAPLEDGRIEIAAISGTSAGAMNAVALADGFTASGPKGARERMHHLWESVSNAAQHSFIKRDPLDVMMGTWSLERSWGYQAMNMMTRLFSPYQFNRADMNPLRDIVEACIDFDCVRHRFRDPAVGRGQAR